MTQLAKYSASCVRARAMRSSFLTPADWKNIVSMHAVDDVVSLLGQKGLLTSSLNKDISFVEKELRENNISSAKALLRFAQEPVRDAIRFFIYYYDLMNIETIIHHLHVGADHADIDSLLYSTGGQGMVDKDLLASVTSFASLANILHGTVLYNSFKNALVNYEQDENISAFVSAIELDFIKSWSKTVASCSNGFRQGVGGVPSFDAFLRVKSADAVFRLRFRRESQVHDFTAWSSLVPGAPLTGSMSEWMEISGEEEAYNYLINIVFSKQMLKDAATDNKNFNINLVDKQLMRMLWNVVKRSQRNNGFDADFLISFLFLMMLQTEDLIAVLECKDFGLEQDSVTDYLIGDF